MLGNLGLGFLFDRLKGNVTAILGGIMAVALIGVTLWGLRVDKLRGQHLAALHKVERQLEAESAAHNATLESLSHCRTLMNETNAAADARAKADAERLARYKQRLASMGADAAKSDERIARLLGMAQHAADTPSCPVSDEALQELKQ
ncbi:hypothetical protein [Stakelama pacifica]|uniref:Uncharacterized protein n=1 Tax=Stakelama pacifica TaxID=517720 RepID=A0A4R6FK06_9SPHN|nr:hypothetical protein [Stakelama pacifica]TDN81802.1 hypothetical protein EV664_107204 [Stakelama pacifica]GGO96612.1 hypothetical protein GCM10011329_23550 [Stakelama pacifica]